MASSNEEHGYKWWLRYVIVPLSGTILGSGGLVAIFIAFSPAILERFETNQATLEAESAPSGSVEQEALLDDDIQSPEEDVQSPEENIQSSIDAEELSSNNTKTPNPDFISDPIPGGWPSNISNPASDDAELFTSLSRDERSLVDDVVNGASMTQDNFFKLYLVIDKMNKEIQEQSDYIETAPYIQGSGEEKKLEAMIAKKNQLFSIIRAENDAQKSDAQRIIESIGR